MPMVEGKKFPYTAAGKKAAKMYAKAEGMEAKAMKTVKKTAKKKTAKKTAKKAAKRGLFGGM